MSSGRFLSGARGSVIVLVIGFAVTIFVGCGPRVSTSEEMDAFAAAGPPPIDIAGGEYATPTPTVGSYRVVPGDLLSIRMPQVLPIVLPDAQQLMNQGRLEVRVDDTGAITLPAVGEVNVVGQTLSQVERIVADSYYPRHVVERPAIVVTMDEFQTVPVFVIGAVNRPGSYELRSDERSLAVSLMKAGGIEKAGARAIHIRRQDGTTLTVPVRNLNLPAQDIQLLGGETVQVQRVAQQIFAVTGLVNKPGTFDYPPDASYSLLDAIGHAGGVNASADPQFARLFRKTADDRLVSVVVRIGESDLPQNGDIPLRPGDSVDVLHTIRTDVRMAISSFFMHSGFYAGATYRLDD